MTTMPVQKPGRSKQDYGTPPEFLAAVKRSLRITDFDIDLAASPFNAVAHIHYNETTNGLAMPWRVEGLSGWNWLNPPFTRIAPWVQRAYEQARDRHARTAVLVPAGVGANWWRDWVHDKAQVLFLNGRLTFRGVPVNPKTGKVDPYPKDLALLLYGYGQITGYTVWDWRRA